MLRNTVMEYRLFLFCVDLALCYMSQLHLKSSGLIPIYI